MKEKEYDRCLICGRKLKHPKCRRLGYGEICYKKYLIYKSKSSLLTNKK